MIWRVRGTGNYLVGTIHALPVIAAAVPSSIANLLPQMGRVVLETDYAAMGAEPEFAFLPAGVSLESLVPAPVLALCRDCWTQLQIPAPLDRHKPWYAALKVAIFSSLRNGVSLNGIDRQIYAAVPPARREFLERIDALRAFDRAPLAEQLAFLEQFGTNISRDRAQFDRLFTAWRSSDLATFATVAGEIHALTPVMSQGLLDGRNEGWRAQILRALSDNLPTMIAVGSLHFVGANNVLEMVRSSGAELDMVPMI